jgi:hypothetical protein
MEDIPMTRKIVIVTLLVLLGAASLWLSGNRRNVGELSDDFYTAADAREFVRYRIEAAKKLNDREKMIVRRLLTQNLRGYIDTSLLDAVQVLGIVGDASTIPQLEELLKETRGGSGQLTIAIERAIEDIQSRDGVSP